MEDKILAILQDANDEIELDSTSLIDEGLLDSFDVVTVVREIEEAFEIEIDAKDVVPENFNSIAAICALVERVQKEA